jgi:hypothetical protein
VAPTKRSSLHSRKPPPTAEAAIMHRNDFQSTLSSPSTLLPSLLIPYAQDCGCEKIAGGIDAERLEGAAMEGACASADSTRLRWILVATELIAHLWQSGFSESGREGVPSPSRPPDSKTAPDCLNSAQLLFPPSAPTQLLSLGLTGVVRRRCL